jgi:hypothetical protein
MRNSYNQRSDYLVPINKYYNEKFIDLFEYKKENNFNRLLKSISLNDVINAIANANTIISDQISKGYKPINFSNYNYYKQNPALLIHKIIESIINKVI